MMKRSLLTYAGLFVVVAALLQAVVFTDQDLAIESTDVDILLVDTGAGKTGYHITLDEACAECLSIEDQSSGNDPLIIEPGAPSSMIYIDSGGDVGIGTSVPSDELTIAATSPSVKWVDTNTNKEWDIDANQTGFFIREDENQLRMMVDVGGNVGIGPFSPTASLDIVRLTGNAAVNLTASTSWQIRSNSVNDQLNFVNNTDSKTPSARPVPPTITCSKSA